MKKLLLWAPFPTATTGYGRLTANFGARLSKHFDLAYFSYTHALGISGLQFQGCPIFTTPHEWANQPKHFVVEVNKYFQPDAILQIFDLFTTWPTLKKYGSLLPIVSYSPVDALPLAQQIWESAKICQKVIPQTKFAKKVYGEAGIESQEVIYHGADPAIYYPRTKEENKAARQAYGIDPGTFLVLMVQDNTRRKNIPSQIKAFQNFKKRTGADAHLLGVIPNIEGMREWDLDLLWSALREGQDDCFSHVFNLSEVELAELYSASDVLLHCSYGEGFGLPMIEAGGCGIPAIATNFSSLPELISDHGWMIDGELAYCQPDGLNTWQMIPSQKGITEALIDAYEDKYKRLQFGEAMRAFVLSECNWDRLTEKMVKVLEG